MWRCAAQEATTISTLSVFTPLSDSTDLDVAARTWINLDATGLHSVDAWCSFHSVDQSSASPPEQKPPEASKMTAYGLLFFVENEYTQCIYV